MKKLNHKRIVDTILKNSICPIKYLSEVIVVELRRKALRVDDYRKCMEYFEKITHDHLVKTICGDNYDQGDVLNVAKETLQKKLRNKNNKVSRVQKPSRSCNKSKEKTK